MRTESKILKLSIVSAMVGMPTIPGHFAVALGSGKDLHRFFRAFDFQSPFEPTGVIVLCMVMTVSGRI